MESLLADRLSVARSSDVGEDGKLLDSNTLQGRHTAAIDGRIALPLKPLRSTRFPPSLINLLAATITSLAVAYLLLRCFERNTLSHGTTLRLLSFSRYRSEDECVWIDEPDSDDEAEEEVESALPADLELLPAFPGTSAVLYPPEPGSAGGVWLGVPLRAGGAEGGYTGRVQGMTEDLEQLEADGWPRLADKSSVNPDGIGFQHSDTIQAEAAKYDPWKDRNIPADVAEQLKRLLCKLRSFSSICRDLLNRMNSRPMMRFTAALMKVLTMQLGVISLVPSSIEHLRMEAGEALIKLGTEAVQLAGNDPLVSRHREAVQDLMLMTKTVMYPREVGEGLAPKKFKSKILGMLGFSSVVSWYTMGIVLGMLFRLNESGGYLTDAFVEQQAKLLSILQAHQLARVVPDCGVRWYIEKSQVKISKAIFFTRDQSHQSNSLPIPTTADFSSSLERDIKAAGDLSYKPTFGLKYIDAGRGIGVSDGASPKVEILSPGNRAIGKVHVPSSTATGVGQEGLRGTIATFPGSSGDASSQATLVFQGSAGMETLLGSWHSPRTQPQFHSGPAYGQQQQGTIQHLPHLHASPHKPGGPQPHGPQPESQAHHNAHHILRPPVGSGIPFRHFQDKTARGKPTWDPSPTEDSTGMRASSPTPPRVEVQPPSPAVLRIPPSYPWEPLRSEQGRSNPLQLVSQAALSSPHGFQGGPETPLGYHDDPMGAATRAPHSFLHPVVESSARHMKDGLQHRPATSMVLPGAPGPVQAQPVSVGLAGWGHHPLPQGQRHFRPSSVPDDPYDGIRHGGILTEHPLMAPGLEGNLQAAMTGLILPPQTGAGSSHLSPQSFSAGPPNAGIQPPVSFFLQYTPGPYSMPPFASSSLMASPQRSGTGPQFSLQPPRFPAAVLPSTSEQAGISSGLGIAGIISNAGRGRPPFNPSLMGFAGSSYGPPRTAMPPAFQHGVEEGMEQMEEIQQAVEAMDPFKDD